MIFWHFCGLGRSNPAHVEHFGMSTVEAMQNGCLPIVFDGGGQREIVEHDISGFRFDNSRELLALTMKVINNNVLRDKLSRAAHERSKLFTRSVFTARVHQLFKQIAAEYAHDESL
jgi:glycosyltransferase involved in cell wall biosynthesis